jgi:hypothetical protein
MLLGMGMVMHNAWHAVLTEYLPFATLLLHGGPFSWPCPIRMPGFFGYIVWSVRLLVPGFVVLTLLFV